MSEISLVQKRIGDFLCDDLARGKDCPNCAKKAERLYAVVLQADKEERNANSIKALERIARYVEALPKPL
jgi:hypothetical protein